MRRIDCLVAKSFPRSQGLRLFGSGLYGGRLEVGEARDRPEGTEQILTGKFEAGLTLSLSKSARLQRWVASSSFFSQNQICSRRNRSGSIRVTSWVAKINWALSRFAGLWKRSTMAWVSRGCSLASSSSTTRINPSSSVWRIGPDSLNDFSISLSI